MTLLDTNVIVYARDSKSPWYRWAKELIWKAISEGGGGACLNAVSLAELCAEDGVDSNAVSLAVLRLGVDIVPVPSLASPFCGAAYRNYRQKRKAESRKGAPRMPLPDFFIGAHAQLDNLTLATNDPARFRTYFPAVQLLTP